MIISLLALYPVSRLDWIVLIRLCFGAITYMTAITLDGQLGRLEFFEGYWITATVRLLTVVALVWLSMTGRRVGHASSTDISVPATGLQPLN
jgi:hypothetical protein